MEYIKNIEIVVLPESQKGLVGFASLVLQLPIGQIRLAGIGVHCLRRGDFSVSWPARKTKTQLIFYWRPLNTEFSEMIKKAVIEEIKKLKLFAYEDYTHSLR